MSQQLTELEKELEILIVSIQKQRADFRGLSEKGFDIHELNLKRKRANLRDTMTELLKHYPKAKK